MNPKINKIPLATTMDGRALTLTVHDLYHLTDLLKAMAEVSHQLGIEIVPGDVTFEAGMAYKQGVEPHREWSVKIHGWHLDTREEFGLTMALKREFTQEITGLRSLESALIHGLSAVPIYVKKLTDHADRLGEDVGKMSRRINILELAVFNLYEILPKKRRELMSSGTSGIVKELYEKQEEDMKADAQSW